MNHQLVVSPSGVCLCVCFAGGKDYRLTDTSEKIKYCWGKPVKITECHYNVLPFSFL